MGDFERDTAVRAGEAGALRCEIDPDWWVAVGPNGGYVAAILARALEAAAGARARPLRSLTVHYLRAPKAGPALVEVEVEREGRSISFVAARLEQEGRPCARAIAVLADPREGVELEQAHPPAVAAPEELAAPRAAEQAPPFARRFDIRPALGPRPFSGAGEALTGGWLRLKRERPLDAALLVALCDAWIPAVFAATTEPLAVPTLELTVHLRARLPLPSDWVLGRFTTRTARDGLLEEDGELWARDGRLLAQSRQLALCS
jgi:acyl-CoA thioesterase